jgi:K+-sensing histidine kinase KdpD
MVRVGRESSEPAGRADESLRLFSRLVSDLVHQVTQPLTVMQGLLEGAMLPGHTATQDTVLLESLGREVDRLSHMVRRIREMAEIESAVEQFLAVPLVQSVKRIVEQLASGVEPQELKVQVDAPQEILVWSSPRRLEWCLRKLISGALRRSPKCGKVRISILSSRLAGILRVSDQGPHIFGRSLNSLPDPLPRCFATSLKSEGDGLEWALAQWMFESSGASLVVRNRAKQGCVVTVTLFRRPRGKPRLKIGASGAHFC